MNLKRRLREKALEIGFAGAGFTNTEPLDLYLQEWFRPPQMYGWLFTNSFDTRKSAWIKDKYPWARSVLVLARNYHRHRFPQALTGVIGRYYQVDERMEKKGEYERMRTYLAFLKGEGIRAWFDAAIPARMAAARAGVATYGKNCFAYARGTMRDASWIEIIPLVLDVMVEPDEPSIEYGCPSWCKNACLAACPTRALYASGKMDPRRCIAYLSFYTKEITPQEFREPWAHGFTVATVANRSVPEMMPTRTRSSRPINLWKSAPAISTWMRCSQ